MNNTLNHIEIYIPGIPKSKQSARFRAITTKDGRSYIASYQKSEIIREEDNLRAFMYKSLPEGYSPNVYAVQLNKFLCIFPPNRGLSKKLLEFIDKGGLIPKVTKPDLTDNLVKIVNDAANGVIFNDDAQIFETRLMGKYYGKNPGVYLTYDIFRTKEELNNYIEQNREAII